MDVKLPLANLVLMISVLTVNPFTTVTPLILKLMSRFELIVVVTSESKGADIEAVNEKGASSDPYLRILRRRTRSSRSFRTAPDDEQSFADSADVLWTSRVCRLTCNPNWGSVCLDVDDLDAGGTGHDAILLQCWDWDSVHEHTIIGTATTTLRELTGGATSQLAAPFKLELTLMVRGSRDDNDSNLRRSGTLEITVDVLDGD